MTFGNHSKGKKIISFFLSALVFATSLFSISTASATADLSLPQGDTLYAIQYSGSNVGSLFSIDPKTGTRTPIGSEDSIDASFAVGATYNPKTKMAYWTSSGDTPNDDHLYSVNLLTGKSTDLGQMRENGTRTVNRGIGINSEGQMYVIYFDGLDYSVGKLNESNGNITDVYRVYNYDAVNFDNVCGSFAFNADTSTFYTTLQDLEPSLWSINTSGQALLIATSSVSEVPYLPCGLAIDSDGNFWTVDGERGNTFFTGKLTEWESQASSQQFTIDGMNTYTLFITPSPDNGAAQRAAEEARRAAEAAAAAAAKKQRELTDLLGMVPAIAGLALNLGVLTNSVLAPKKSSSAKQKCVKGTNTKYVKKGTKCPKGYSKKK